MILFIALSLSVAFFASWAVVFWINYQPLKVLPSPRILPFFGNALEFKSTEETLSILTNLYRILNTKTIRLHVGFRTFIQTKDYAFLEHLLTSQTILSKGIGYNALHRWLGLGLLTADGVRWRMHRKTITPTFHFQILEQFLDVFYSRSKIMIEKMRRDVGRPSTDIFPYVTLCALDIICDFIYKFTNLYRQETAALDVLHGYTNEVIHKRRDQLLRKQEDGKESKSTDEDYGKKKRTAFLDMLLHASVNGVALTDQQIREEIDTFMFEGHDTSAAGICYCLFNLATHPEVQRKVFDEQRAIFNCDKNRESTYKDLQEMKYLELVIKETLRLYPSVPVFARRTSEDVHYKNFVVPKGMTIGIFAYGIQRDPDFCSEPEKFIPERFAPENYDGKRPFSFIPFSAGPRNCIGQKFAMLELKSTISKVIRHYELRAAASAHQLKLAAQSILKSVNGIKLALHDRKY